MRPLFLGVALLLFGVGVSSGDTACLVTLPPNPAFIPPAPYDQLPVPEGGFWYGTDALWTSLTPMVFGTSKITWINTEATSPS